MAGRMHPDEVEVGDALVRRLLSSQPPHLADLGVRRLDSAGTVNAIFRLGPDLCVRLPLRPDRAPDLDRELAWLDRLRPHLPLRIPRPVAVGEPGSGYPFRWAVYRWIDGVPYAEGLVGDEVEAAVALAGFVRSFRTIAASGAPVSGRPPLEVLDAETRRAMESIGDGDLMAPVAAAWERSLEAPPWDGVSVWRHGDLLPANLLLSAGRLHAVIDFGGSGVGDPAADLIPAWTVFGPTGRSAFGEAIGDDGGTWDRARGLALHQALVGIPYYSISNPGFAAMAWRTVDRILGDLGSG